MAEAKRRDREQGEGQLDTIHHIRGPMVFSAIRLTEQGINTSYKYA
ncbi:MAG: hypothetical protein ACI9TH_003706 [Kiritimatiellia bacterium]